MDKLNDPDTIKWTMRFQKVLIELKITSPVDSIREFCFVLMNMFAAVRQDLKEIQSVLHLTLSGNSKTWTLTEREQKAPKGHPARGTF